MSKHMFLRRGLSMRYQQCKESTNNGIPHNKRTTLYFVLEDGLLEVILFLKCNDRF